MAEDSGGQERTEQPTARRRTEAHRDGQVARSTELSTAFVLLAGTVVMMTSAGAGFTRFSTGLFRDALGAMSFRDLGAGGAVGFLRHTAGGYLLAFMPYALGMTAVVVLINLIQAKGVLSLTPITPKFSNVNPGSGIKRVFSTESLFTGLKAVLKLTAIGLLSYFLLSRAVPELGTLGSTGPAQIAAALFHLLGRLAILMGLAYLVLAAIDYGYQHRKMERKMLMTREEVKNDTKNTEGNPMVKSKIMAMAHAMARRRMLQDVGGADVVVTNPTHIAVALRYDVSVSAAPTVVAMGQRKLAERIKSLARRAGVPLVENRPVARALLATAEVGRPIPPALYAAVAEILAYVYRLRDRSPAADSTLPTGSIS